MSTNDLESAMQGVDFNYSEKGTGAAAVLVLSALVEWLCVSKQLSPDELNTILNDAEDRAAGDLVVLKDARKVIGMMRSRFATA